MTDIDYDIIEARIDELPADRFERPANWAAAMLAEYGYAYVILEPGDATNYRIMIIAPGTEWHGSDVVDQHRYYHVALSMGMGFGYDWAGHQLDPSYVASKWVVESRPGAGYHAACVLTRFLNALADRLNQ